MSIQTAQALAEETGTAVEKRRFRANIYADLADRVAYGENGFIGRQLRIGDTAVVAMAERDMRCVMINLHPDSAAMDPAILKRVAQAHGGAVGIYGNVIAEGMIRSGDAIELLD